MFATFIGRSLAGPLASFEGDGITEVVGRGALVVVVAAMVVKGLFSPFRELLCVC